MIERDATCALLGDGKGVAVDPRALDRAREVYRFTGMHTCTTCVLWFKAPSLTARRPEVDDNSRRVTWGFNRSRSQAAQLDSSKVTCKSPTWICRSSSSTVSKAPA